MSGRIYFVKWAQTRRAARSIGHVHERACILVSISVYVCEWVSIAWSCFSSGGEWQRTGVIGRTFHHWGISFQFSKLYRTSDAINKVFSQTRGGKMQVSSYLIIPLIALRRENELPCAVRGKVRLKCMKRRRHVQRSNATITLYRQYNTEHQAAVVNYQRTNKQNHTPGECQSDHSNIDWKTGEQKAEETWEEHLLPLGNLWGKYSHQRIISNGKKPS